MRLARSPISLARADALHPGFEIAERDLLGDAIDLDDRAADPERESDRAGARHGEADQRPQAEAVQHLLDREMRRAAASRPGSPSRTGGKGERAEHHLAVGPLIRLDADDRRGEASISVASATIA